jgi:hypothetical protein
MESVRPAEERRERRKQQIEKAIRFLKIIFAKVNGLIEIRCLPSGQRLFSRNYKAIAWFVRSHLHENIYFGVGTRRAMDGTKKGTFEVPALWVDIDWKHFRGGRIEADKVLENCPVRPSIIIRSGHGYHVYWLLRKPEKANSAIEGYLKGLASMLRADQSAAELARVLRVSGTFNYKGTNPVPVEFKKLTKRLYALADFEFCRRKEKRIKRTANVHFSRKIRLVDLDKFKLTPRVLELIKSGWDGTPYKSRSEADQAVITALVRAQAKDDEIRAIFARYPIGEKYREGAGDKYLHHSIATAKRFIRERSDSL